ncbi:hypothetical protein V8C35DRAFT_309329 [Trichoderma chlorosporum]
MKIWGRRFGAVGFFPSGAFVGGWAEMSSPATEQIAEKPLTESQQTDSRQGNKLEEMAHCTNDDMCSYQWNKGKVLKRCCTLGIVVAGEEKRKRKARLHVMSLELCVLPLQPQAQKIFP